MNKKAVDYASQVSTEGRVLVDMYIGKRIFTRVTDIVYTSFLDGLQAGSSDTLNDLALRVHDANAKWWVDINTGEPLKRNVGELLMLSVSELAEAMEGHRKNLMDDKLPHRKMFEVEIADCLIRLLDISAGFGLDIGGCI